MLLKMTTMHHTTNFSIRSSLRTLITQSFLDKPVLFLETKESRRITLRSARKEVDNQMRIRMRDLAPACPLEILNGVSAFGTQLSFYTYDKQTRMIIPARISPHMETDAAPLDRWDCDLLEDEGAQRFQNLVAEIKIKCDQL
ncbi:hypothetical protein EDB86DRAFT_968252 [Lactarius hatsudake]|nr:hypothetical protein EDB86DRAFT_968252 [Lactarius hatsudake]